MRFVIFYFVFAVFSGGVFAQPVDKFITEREVKNILIVEAMRPYTVKVYKEKYDLTLSRQQILVNTPEAVVWNHVNSMRLADVDWNNSLWTDASQKMMQKMDAADGRNKEYYANKWRKTIDYKYQLLQKIEWLSYALIEYEVVTPKGKYTDFSVLENKQGKWYLTQEISNDPMIFGWKSKTGRVRIMDDAFVNANSKSPK